MQINPFEIALGIQTPWKITDTELIPSEKNPNRLEMHIYVDFEEGSRFPCPICGEEEKVYDTRERVWRHLNFFQYRSYIHARVPRIECKEHGVKTIEVPWGRAGSGFTLMMEGVILTLLRHLPVAAAAREIGEHDTKLWRVLSFYVEEAKKGRSFADVEAIGVDEYSHKGHNYITVFFSHPTEKNPKARVLDIEDGKGKESVTSFSEVFSTFHGHKEKVKDITSDMCHGYRNAMKDAFPEATVTVDRFHVMKMMGDCVDCVRKREMRSKDRRKQEKLNRSRYLFLKNRENLSAEQCSRLDELLASDDLDTVIAYSYRLRLQDMYECRDYETACSFLEELALDMANSKVRELWNIAKSLTRNAEEILNYFVSRKTNAILEGFNSKISLIKSRARGFRNMDNFKNMIYFCMGGFDFPFIPIME